ncbi:MULTISPECIES: YlxM family DNA-binding protein [Fructobacillus]|uniref:UPF0122 protein FTRO_0022090 n=3 Tax=Fructobacillus TaxID=559173 RepID=A0A3F3H7W6_9LACO|nr:MULTISPECIES: YlxM family DNA-binding protein [Fructobacillus]CAK1244936.1 Predicted DNA-binding protein YlxM [Fructobacillus sp. LMG 32999]USS91927.1 YlxM family DNA-binding protein [Fructobacillus americanaquae]CAK1225875.1 Predicted DNA-binding protein YlxM [Fructobacillus tropaeoli]CAK1234502.1 Predicted DNA-binding protein YlxM [Fructobacillus tropaeoli]CAK1235582.1 Predicted DNA-binding protein YlxM [Fructobacillus tropaeoli]
MDLDKKNQVNALLPFYGPLLTVKQQNYLRAYFEDDYSIIEIAEAEVVSRQAVSDNLKRGVDSLEHYEAVLGLYKDSVHRQAQEQDLLDYVAEHYQNDQHLKQILDQLVNQEIN